MPIQPVRLGISQAHGGTTVLEGARVFAKSLSSRINVPVRLTVAEDYAALYRMVTSKGCEIAWLPPFVYMAAMNKGIIIAAVCERNGALTYRSAIVVHADSKLKTLQDLNTRGLRAAWTDPSSAAGHIFPRMYLASQGINPDLFEERFTGAPITACAAVVEKQADLCACFVSEASAHDPNQILTDLKRVYAAAQWRLRVLAVVDPIPSDAIVIMSHVEPALRERMTEAMLGFHTHTEGRDALAKLLYADKLVVPTPELLQRIESLRPLMPAIDK